MDGQGYAKSLSDGAKIFGAALLGVGIGFGIGIAAGPGIIGSLIFGIAGAALGGAAGYSVGVIAVDGVAELKKLKNKIIKRAKPHAQQAQGLFSKLRKDMSDGLENTSEKLKRAAKSVPDMRKTGVLGNKTAQSDFSDNAKKTGQTVTETPAPAQKADVKNTTGAKRKM